jgi:hypothetical protein
MIYVSDKIKAEMKGHIIFEIINYLGSEIGSSFHGLFVLLLLLILHKFYKTWKTNETKLEEIQSNERIEKLKLEVDREKGKPPPS